MNLEMLKISDNNVIVNGIYSLSEAALYANMSKRTLQSWIHGSNTSTRIIKQKNQIEEGDYINFLDFIQALAIREIRKQHKISLSKIREAVDFLSVEHGIEYPLAMRHEIYTDKKGLLIYLNGKEDLLNITSPNKEQFVLKIIEDYLSRVKYSDEGYARSYHPIDGIIMDPEIRFGEPIVERCGIRAITLYDAVYSEGGISNAAAAFGVETNDIQIAHDYIDSLQKVA